MVVDVSYNRQPIKKRGRNMDMNVVRDILIAVVPALVAGYTAYRQWSDKQDFGRQISALQIRIAVLEQFIVDNKLPLPQPAPASEIRHQPALFGKRDQQ